MTAGTPRARAELVTTTCSTPGCDRTHLARGLCGAHYYQARRRERGLAVRVVVAPQTLEALGAAAAAAGVTIEALAGSWLSERAAARSPAAAGAQPVMHHA